MLVDLAAQRRGPGRAVRERAGRGAHDPREVFARDAPDQSGRGRSRARAEPDRRAARDLPGRNRERCAQSAGDGDHRRARADQAGSRTRGSSATSISPATSTPRSRSARWCGATARPRSRRAPGSSLIPSPDDEVIGMPQQGPGVVDGSRRRGAPRSDRELTLDAIHSCCPRSTVTSSRCGVPTPRRFSRVSCRKTSTRSASGFERHALLLEPRGKLVVDLRAAHVSDDEWWCVCEPGFGSVLARGPQALQDPGEGRDRRSLRRCGRGRGARRRCDRAARQGARARGIDRGPRRLAGRARHRDRWVRRARSTRSCPSSNSAGARRS